MPLVIAVLASLAAALPAFAKEAPVKVLQAWSGFMPSAVPPLFQSSVTTAEALQRVWSTCQLKDVPPKVDFGKHVVLLAVRPGTIRFTGLTLDNGNLRTNVAVAPGDPNRMTCALALVNRAGIKTVNGAPLGK